MRVDRMKSRAVAAIQVIRARTAGAFSHGTGLNGIDRVPT